MEATSMETATTAEDTRRSAAGRKCDHRSGDQQNNNFSEHEKLPDFSRADFDFDLTLFKHVATSLVSNGSMQLDVIIDGRRDAEYWAVRGSPSPIRSLIPRLSTKEAANLGRPQVTSRGQIQDHPTQQGDGRAVRGDQ
jgi:hypothetical protein